jgi:hypothetical protein
MNKHVPNTAVVVRCRQSRGGGWRKTCSSRGSLCEMYFSGRKEPWRRLPTVVTLGVTAAASGRTLRPDCAGVPGGRRAPRPADNLRIAMWTHTRNPAWRMLGRRSGLCNRLALEGISSVWPALWNVIARRFYLSYRQRKREKQEIERSSESSGMYYRVPNWVSTNVSDVRAASIIRAMSEPSWLYRSPVDWADQ